jgi:hypothetical protein
MMGFKSFLSAAVTLVRIDVVQTSSARGAGIAPLAFLKRARPDHFSDSLALPGFSLFQSCFIFSLSLW